MSIFSQRLQTVDPDIYHAIEQGAQRQEDHIELIASENYASPAVLSAPGSVLTNKYAEGYPGKRPAAHDRAGAGLPAQMTTRKEETP